MNINYTTLPEHMKDAMLFYIEDGIHPGSFLAAVLSNDLMKAISRADEINAANLQTYCRFLYNEAPSTCYGSSEKFDAWVNHFGLSGMETTP